MTLPPPAPRRSSARPYALLTALLVVTAGAWWRRPPPRKPAADGPVVPKVTPVRAVRIRRRPLRGALARNGTVRARVETHLQFGAAGRVVRFDVEKGQFVRKGDLLARLDESEAEGALRAAELEFRRAAEKYFQDRTIDRLDYEKAKLRHRQARLAFEKTSLRAPHAGYLVEKWVLPGEQVDAGTAVGKLMDKSRMDVELNLSENDIARLKVGQSVEVSVDALPGLRLKGRVASVTPYLQGAARSFAVKVPLAENPGEVLAPGMYARCVIHHAEKADALVVPAEAGVASDGGRVKVFLVDESNRVHARSVPVLFEADGEWAVGEAAEGDTVVLNPPLTLTDGATVTVVSLYDPATETAGPGAPGGR